MARTIFSGGRVFDGSATLALADFAVEGVPLAPRAVS